MSHPYPRGRRRRPGRRPHDRRSRGLRAQGFSAPGWRQFYDSFRPWDGGSKRQYFNMLSGAIVLGIAVGCGACGLTQFGLLGGLAGLITGGWAAGRWVTEGRFYRP